MFDDLESFKKWFDFHREQERDQVMAKEKGSLIYKLHDILRPFLLRRLKMDVDLEIPSKHEYVLFTPMTELQKEYYDAVMRDDFTPLLKRFSIQSKSTCIICIIVFRAITNIILVKHCDAIAQSVQSPMAHSTRITRCGKQTRTCQTQECVLDQVFGCVWQDANHGQDFDRSEAAKTQSAHLFINDQDDGCVGRVFAVQRVQVLQN